MDPTNLSTALLDAAVDARLGKELDVVRAFNRALATNRSLTEHDRAAYVKEYRDSYTKECKAMRAEGRL